MLEQSKMLNVLVLIVLSFKNYNLTSVTEVEPLQMQCWMWVVIIHFVWKMLTIKWTVSLAIPYISLKCYKLHPDFFFVGKSSVKAAEQNL